MYPIGLGDWSGVSTPHAIDVDGDQNIIVGGNF